MKPLSIIFTIVVAVLIIVVGWMLGPGASWWLEHVDGGVACAPSANPKTVGVTCLPNKDWVTATDAVRGRVLALATGLAALAAVYYTARNADTARHTFQLGGGHDTDRYGKAAEQLGHAQASVRLAGLYALEELAQNTPRLRQTIVNVICAYLRMPYPPPREDRYEQIRAARRNARIIPKGHEARLAERGALEEMQVRLTAQRILTDHLRRGRLTRHHWWQRAPVEESSFWHGIRIDLTGATLFSFDFTNCHVGWAAFTGATFANYARFTNAIFTDGAEFAGAIFPNYVRFNEVTFSGHTIFDEVRFAGGVGFDIATFTGRTTFRKAAFVDLAAFLKVTFNGSTEFDGAIFSSFALFDEATIAERISFHEATFADLTTFKNTTFAGKVAFDLTPSFLRAINSGGTDKWQNVDLAEARVAPSAQAEWPPGWRLESSADGIRVLRKVR